MPGTTNFPSGVDGFPPLEANTPENAMPLPGGGTGGHHDFLNSLGAAVDALELFALTRGGVPGREGEDGEDGLMIPGPPGPPGADGSGSGSAGPSGPPGMRGDDGEDAMFVPGAPGTAGAAGAAGRDGIGFPGQDGADAEAPAFPPGSDMLTPQMIASIANYYRRDDVGADGTSRILRTGGNIVAGTEMVMVTHSGSARPLLSSEYSLSANQITITAVPTSGDTYTVTYWSQTPFPAATVFDVSDIYWTSVVAALHFDGTNGSTTFTDQKGRTYTALGASVISTTQSKFGGSSLSCPSATTGITTADGSQWNRGTSEWCLDCWIYPTSNAADGEIWSHRHVGAASGFELLRRKTDGTIRYVANNGSNFIDRTSTATAPINTWTYVRVQRRLVSGSLVVEVSAGGVYGQSGTDSAAGSIPDVSAGYNIGAGDDASGGGGFIGFIDDFRDEIGHARDTGNFTPPIAAFANQ